MIEFYVSESKKYSEKQLRDGQFPNSDYEAIMKAINAEIAALQQHLNIAIEFGDKIPEMEAADDLKVLEPLRDAVQSMREQRLDKVIDLSEAQKQYEELLKYIEENEAAFDKMDLKLHKAIGTAWDLQNQLAEEGITVWDKNMEDVFYNFCNSYYEEFIAELKEQGIDFESMQNQIGRTSSFKLHDFGDKAKDIISEISYKMMSNAFDDYLDIDENNQLTINAEWADYTRDELQYYAARDLEHIEKDLFEDVKRELEDIVRTYNLIQEYKENQVESFNEYAQDAVEDAREQKDRRIEEAQKEAIRKERHEQLDKLTDRLAKTKSFDEMKDIAKQIKEIKDQMRKDDNGRSGRDDRSGKEER